MFQGGEYSVDTSFIYFIQPSSYKTIYKIHQNIQQATNWVQISTLLQNLKIKIPASLQMVQLYHLMKTITPTQPTMPPIQQMMLLMLFLQWRGWYMCHGYARDSLELGEDDNNMVDDFDIRRMANYIERPSQMGPFVTCVLNNQVQGWQMQMRQTNSPLFGLQRRMGVISIQFQEISTQEQNNKPVSSAISIVQSNKTLNGCARSAMYLFVRWIEEFPSW